MKIYRVGGSVRDELLGLKSNDRDYVVVGSNPDEMLKLGFKSVGKDFPVFLHPKTREEYALARRERKIAKGYTGFQFDTNAFISLEDDLLRRDITINAIAIDEETDQIIDPFHGVDDLRKGIIRHVSEAFIEDPLRILRVARFSARFNFKIASETLDLMKQITKSGELNALSKERIWQEFERAFKNKNPDIFLIVLHQVGALSIICPEIDDLISLNHQQLFNYLNDKTINNLGACEIFALIAYLIEINTPHSMLKSLLAPNKFITLAKLVINVYPQVITFEKLTPDQILALIKKIDPKRKKDRFNLFLKIINLLAKFDSSLTITKNINLLMLMIKSMNNIDYYALSLESPSIVKNIYAKKIDIILNVLLNNKV